MSREPTPLYLVFDGAALDGPLYRIVRGCPPVLEDFLSYEASGKPYDRRDYFKGLGISMYSSRRRAIAIARRFGHGRGVARVDVRSAPLVWTRGSRGHHTVWAPAEILLETVVQCDEHE